MLNHLSFPSTNVLATVNFFEKYLGCTVASRHERACILKRPGFDIVIEDLGTEAAQWPPNFHLGFELASFEELVNIFHVLEADDIEMQTDLIKHPRGSRFFCRIPGGFSLEINTRADANEHYRGSFNN